MEKRNCCEHTFQMSLVNCGNLLSSCNKCQKYNKDMNFTCGSNNINICYPIYLITTPILLAVDLVSAPFKCMNYFGNNCCNLEYDEEKINQTHDNTINNNILNDLEKK